MRVLIVKTSALGDIIHSLPVAMAIRRQVPVARIDWVVEAPSFNLLQGHMALNNVYLSPRHVFKQGFAKGLRALPPFMRQLRAIKYDAVLDLQGLMKSSIFVLLSKGQKKIGFKGGKEPLSAWPLNLPLPAYDIERHALERYLDLLAPIGLERPAEIEYGLQPRPELLAKYGQMLAGSGPLVVLHPMAKWPSKLWPEEHWANVAAGLAKAGARVVFSGGAEDRRVNQQIISLSGGHEHIVDLSGQTSLQEVMAVLGLSDLVVSTDTGIMHLAAALQKPLVALFGPTAANRTGPYGQGHIVLSNQVDCRPCFRRQCANPLCLHGLSAQLVLATVLNRLRLS